MSELFLKTGAHFSPCRVWRYALWRTWDESEAFCAFIGLNPSTADETANDPTVTRCINYARAWGYGGLVMLNLFGFRATDPEVMKAAEDPIGPENFRVIQEYHEAAGLTVAAWGNHGEFLDQDVAVSRLDRIGPHAKSRFLGDDLWCLKKTAKGHPWHPLYLPATLKPVRFTCRRLAA